MLRHAKTIVRRTSQVAFESRADDAPHPLLRRVLENRGIDSAAALEHSLSDLLPPDNLKGIDAAAERLISAIEQQQRVLIIGDYDVDGATACALAVLGLKQFGLQSVDYLVPNRFKHGYGLSPGIVAHALRASHKPDLVVTVDNGINSIDGVALLRREQVDVIITDHHLAGPVLPDANAIVNPNQPDCEFAGKATAGVGVMFYLLSHLRAQLRKRNPARDEVNLANYLDLVALGTAADLVPLDRNNRILVAQGLARIRRGHCRPGIRAMFLCAGKSFDAATTKDFSYVLGPRLNAAGRIDDITVGIECLLADEQREAMRLAGMLNQRNAQRREIESDMQAQALQLVNELQQQRGNGAPPSAWCLFRADWHQGLSGLIASRIREYTDTPTIAFAAGANGDLTGSARSVPNLHMRDLLARIDAERPGLLQKFGGHAMAAGLTIAKESLPEFTAQFERAAADALAHQPPQNEIWSDGELQPEWFTLECATMLANAAPWGQHFPAPVFDAEFEVIRAHAVGRQHLRLALRHAELADPLDAIAFHAREPNAPAPDFARVQLAFRLDANEFRGHTRLQLLVEHIQPSGE